MPDLDYILKLKENPELQNVEWFLCKEDPYYFLTEWCYTLDSHDLENPIKLFPKKEYIKILTDIWLKVNLLLVPKSRQMMVSWLFSDLYLWDTIFHVGRLNFFQSKREDDADDLIKRSKFGWDYLPSFLKRYKKGDNLVPLNCNPQHKGQHIFCKMQFPEINSEIRGIPQGGDIIRMQTASGIFSDEMAFQPEAKKAYIAAKPTLSKGGRWTGVSTAEDNTYFDDLIYDREEK